MTRPNFGTVAAALVAGALLSGVAAQACAAPAPKPKAGPSVPADRASPKAVVDAVFQSVSGPADVPRDYNRLRALAAPDARFVMVTRSPRGPIVQSMDFDGFVQAFTGLTAGRAYYESELSRKSEGYGDLMTVNSRYEAHIGIGNPPVARGLHAWQLVHLRDGWKIQTLLWEEEPAGDALPVGTGRPVAPPPAAPVRRP